MYCTEALMHERPRPSAYPLLHTNSQELLNQPCVIKVALGMRVQLAHVPPEMLAHPRRYCPVPHVLHSATGQELLKAPWEVKYDLYAVISGVSNAWKHSITGSTGEEGCMSPRMP